jgi:hypothetical protein
MNEWVIAAIVVVGTLLAAGGGGLIANIFRRKPETKA